MRTTKLTQTFGYKINRTKKTDLNNWLMALAVLACFALSNCAPILGGDTSNQELKEGVKDSLLDSYSIITVKQVFTWNEIETKKEVLLENANYYTPYENLFSYSLSLSYYDYETEKMVTEYLDTAFYEVYGKYVVIDYKKANYFFEDYAKIISLTLVMEFEKKPLVSQIIYSDTTKLNTRLGLDTLNSPVKDSLKVLSHRIVVNGVMLSATLNDDFSTRYDTYIETFVYEIAKAYNSYDVSIIVNYTN